MFYSQLLFCITLAALDDQENVPPANILPDFSAYEFPRTLRSALKGLSFPLLSLRQSVTTIR